MRVENNSDQKKSSLEPKKPEKKHHRLRNFLITLGVIIVVLVLVIGYLGIYKIPVVSSLMGTDKPKDLGVQASAEALEELKEKIPMKITGDYVDFDRDTASRVFTGSISVDAKTTSEEITSWLQRFEGEDPIFSQVQVKYFPGGMEISGQLNKYIKAPVYVKVGVTQVSDKIELDIEKATLGRIPVPEGYLDQAEDWFEKKVNHLIEAIPGLSLEKYELNEGYSYFKGTYPAEVKKSKMGFSALLGL